MGEALTPFQMTYAGRTRSGNVTKYRYVDHRDGNTYVFTKQPIKGATIGATYDVNETADGRMRTGGEGAPRYVSSLGRDDPRVVEWRSEDLSVATELARAGAIAKAGDPWQDIERLHADCALSMTRPQRRALAARLLEVLYL